MSKPVLKIVCGGIIEFDGHPAEELFESESRVLFDCNNRYYVYKKDTDTLHEILKADVYSLLLKLMAIGSNMDFTLVDA